LTQVADAVLGAFQDREACVALVNAFSAGQRLMSSEKRASHWSTRFRQDSTLWPVRRTRWFP